MLRVSMSMKQVGGEKILVKNLLHLDTFALGRARGAPFVSAFVSSCDSESIARSNIKNL